MSKPRRSISIFRGLRQAHSESGKGRWAILRDWRRLRRSGRRLLLSEYLAFGLYRDDARPGEFLGIVEATKLSLALNHRSHRRALVRDKLLFDAMMRGLGYPVPGLQAVLSRVPYAGTFASLGTAREVLAFLEQGARFPVFCKPVHGQGGRDSVAIRRLDGRELEYLDGTREQAHLFAERAAARHGTGLMIQDLVRQHPDLTAICGETVATVRVFTFWEGREIHVLGAAWKIPTGGAMADNLGFGSYIAHVDAETGQVGTVRAAVAPGADRITRHPVSGVALGGQVLPHWLRVREVCAGAARLLYGMPLVGWDVAIAAEGPVLIEANSVPGLEAVQYLDMQGFLQDNLLDRMEAEIVRLKKTARAEARGRRRKVAALAWDRVLQGIGFTK